MQKLACLLAVLLIPLAAQPPANSTWKFAVSGDSRNCGDIVMPAIASGVLASRSEFYWHLGDFRAIYTFDEDMVPPASLALPAKPLNIIDYENGAWPDFIDHPAAPVAACSTLAAGQQQPAAADGGGPQRRQRRGNRNGGCPWSARPNRQQKQRVSAECPGCFFL
jgi:hypothetical protein